MTGDESDAVEALGDTLAQLIVANVSLVGLAAFVWYDLPGLFAFVAQVVTAVVWSALALRAMDVL